MGLVKSRTMYRTDGGKVMAVEEMTASHLLNAIGHHQRQADTVEAMLGMGYKPDFLKPRVEELESTLVILRTELESRDSTKDEERDHLDKEVYSQVEDRW